MTRKQTLKVLPYIVIIRLILWRETSLIKVLGIIYRVTFYFKRYFLFYFHGLSFIISRTVLYLLNGGNYYVFIDLAMILDK